MEGQTKWYDLILANWSQIAVMLAAIGYIIQKIADWSLRKKEITFTRLQENKILEIKSFYKSYLSLEVALRGYLHQTEFGEHKDEIFNEIKRKIYECFLDFNYSSMTVKLFLSDGDIKTVDEIYKVLESIRVDIGGWHIYKNSGNSSKDFNQKLTEIMDERFPKTLPSLIKKIETSLRKSYNVT